MVGFHFVCPNRQGVLSNDDGTLWSGTWVVDQVHAKRAPTVNAYIALHASKTLPSYLQGRLTGWRKSSRASFDFDSKIEEGIDFLFVPTHEAYRWVGSGAGEKGYAWRGA